VAVALAGCGDVAPAGDAGVDVANDLPWSSPGEGPIVINEISAGPSSWIELYNASDAPAALGSQLLTGGDAPDDRYVLITKGNALGPRQYVVLRLDPADGGGGAPCVRSDGGPSFCFQGVIALDDARGGSIGVMRFAGSALGAVTFPAGVAASGATWGRAPDGSEHFAPTRPTPGAPNVPR
jgi:hypothetical protein